MTAAVSAWRYCCSREGLRREWRDIRRLWMRWKLMELRKETDVLWKEEESNNLRQERWDLIIFKRFIIYSIIEVNDAFYLIWGYSIDRFSKENKSAILQSRCRRIYHQQQKNGRWRACCCCALLGIYTISTILLTLKRCYCKVTQVNILGSKW